MKRSCTTSSSSLRQDDWPRSVSFLVFGQIFGVLTLATLELSLQAVIGVRSIFKRQRTIGAEPSGICGNYRYLSRTSFSGLAPAFLLASLSGFVCGAATHQSWRCSNGQVLPLVHFAIFSQLGDERLVMLRRAIANTQQRDLFLAPTDKVGSSLDSTNCHTACFTLSYQVLHLVLQHSFTAHFLSQT